MRSQHANPRGIRTLIAAIVALCLCPVLAYAAPAYAAPAYEAAAEATPTGMDLTVGQPSPDDALCTQDMTGAIRRPTETIAINKTYSRDASKYDSQTYRFKSKGGAYVLKVNNKTKGTARRPELAGSTVKAFLTASVSTGKGKYLFIGEWCHMGTNTFKLGTIKKGATVSVELYAYPRESSSKFSFKVESVKEKLTKSNTEVTVKDATWTGKALKPAVTVKYDGKKLKKGTDYTVKYSNNVEIGKATVAITGKGSYKGTVKSTFKIKPKGKVYACAIMASAKMDDGFTSEEQFAQMKNLLKNNKVKGYTFDEKNDFTFYREDVHAALVQSEFESTIENAFAGCTSNDICYLYYGGHGADENGVGAGLWVYDDGNGYANTIYPYDKLISLFDKNIKGKAVLVLDACYSGGFIKALKKSSSSLKDRAIVLASASDKETAGTTGNILTNTYYQKFSYLLLFKGKKMDTSPKDGYLNAQEICSYEKRRINKIIGAGYQTPEIYAGKKMSKKDNIFKVL